MHSWVVLLALAAILLLAAGVCALHYVNAVFPCGTVAVSGYAPTDGAAENLVPIVEEPWADAGIIHISGALLRMDQEVGAVNVRVALIPEKIAEGEPAKEQEEAILLKTQMVRRQDMKQTYGVDDHCGFHATVKRRALKGEGWQYRVALVDETDGAKRMIETNLWIAAIDGGLAHMRRNLPEQEVEAHD